MCCCCCEDCKCRPLGFLLGLPFAFLALFVGFVDRCSVACPCCLCVTVAVEFALALINVPILVMKWFTSKIPC
ncbi:Signaling peptide TAXIMIN 1, partial [Cucurbita argyrosperma subsp. sororia]